MKLKPVILNIVMGLMLLVGPMVLSTGVAHAGPFDFLKGKGKQQQQQPQQKQPSSCPTGDSAKAQVLQGIGQTGSQCDDSQVNQVFRTIVEILSLLVGVTSVIVILIAGFKYMTSGGEQARVANAKSTLLYAVVGLFVAATAQLLIHFVLFQANRTS